jgi:protein-disulfide isomerase/uncharacterized membrane protein
MPVLDVIWERLRGYRPLWEKTLFGLCMGGLLLVTHLHIQEGRSFDRGCFGFAGLEGGHLGFDCSSVLASEAGTFLGLSNITWGFGFYLTIALLTLATFFLHDRMRGWVHGVRVGGIGAGTVYAVYLVYVQLGVLGTLCALCLLSALVTVLLCTVQAVALVRPFDSVASVMPTRLFKRDLTIYVYLAAITAVLIGADVTYFGALTPADEDRARAHREAYSGAACKVDVERAPVDDPGSLVTFQDVTKGPADAPVTIIEYFDPNCPHCKDFHNETMKPLVSKYEGQVRFVYKPFPLQGASLPEIQALYAAHQEGKFTEMLEAQYARQKRAGISTQDLRAIATEIGMNPDVLMSRIEQKKYQQHVLKQRKRAIQIGVRSTPTVLINGHFAGSRSLECMEMFIERAKKGTLGSGSAQS